MAKKIAIIGAGISGLVCAYELQKKGFNVSVFEKNGYVGGRMASRAKDGFMFDIGADHLCDLYDEIKKYCEELGVRWEKMRFEQYGIIRNRQIKTFANVLSLKSNLKLLNEIKNIKEHSINFLNLSEAADLDTDNAYDLMERKLGQEVADYIVDPFTVAYQFHSARDISSGALTAILQSFRFQRKEWELHRTEKGMSALPDAIAEKLNVKLNTPVVSVNNNTISLENGKKLEFDAVVFACTANIALNILQNPNPAQKNLLEKTRYASTISVAFKVPEEILQNPYSIIWVPLKESKIISGIANETCKGDELKNEGKALLCAWYRHDYAKNILDKPNEEIFDIIKGELKEICPWVNHTEELENHDLQKWPQAMPIFAHGHLKMVKDFLEKDQGENNMYFTGDYLNSPWTEGSVRCGQRVAQRLSSQLSG